jgi:YggT family protein
MEMVGSFLLTFARFLVYALWFLVLGRIVASWVDPYRRHPVSRFFVDATEPFLAPIRRLLPPSGPIDFSPLVLMLLLSLLVGLLRS